MSKKYFPYIVCDAITKLCQAYSETLGSDESDEKTNVMKVARTISEMVPRTDDYTKDVLTQLGSLTATGQCTSERVRTVCEYAIELVRQIDTEFKGRLLSQLKEIDSDFFTGEKRHGSPTYFEFIHLMMNYRIPKLINERVNGEPLSNNHGKKWNVLIEAAKKWHSIENKGGRLDEGELHSFISGMLGELKAEVRSIQDETDKATTTREHQQKDVSHYASMLTSRSTFRGFFNAARTAASKVSGGMVADGKGELLRLLEPFIKRFNEAEVHQSSAAFSFN